MALSLTVMRRQVVIRGANFNFLVFHIHFRGEGDDNGDDNGIENRDDSTSAVMRCLERIIIVLI